MPKVTFLPQDSTVDVSEGLSLFAAAIDADVEVESQCGGRGGCALCRVIVREGADNLSPMEWEEQNHLGNVFHVTHERLACQSRILGDVVVEIPPPVERTKKPYIPHKVRRNLEQMVQARLEAAETEQDSLRSVKGRTRRRRGRRESARGPLESRPEMEAAPSEGGGASGERRKPEGNTSGPEGDAGGKPADSSEQQPERRRSRRRRRPRRRRGGTRPAAKPSGGGQGGS